jgi:hypothetical protein
VPHRGVLEVKRHLVGFGILFPLFAQMPFYIFCSSPTPKVSMPTSFFGLDLHLGIWEDFGLGFFYSVQKFFISKKGLCLISIEVIALMLT